MAESRWRWNRREWSALLFLGQLAAEGSGYTLRGVRGWAHLNDLREPVGSGLFDVLPRLYARGLLDRVDVRAPGQLRPVWVWRITMRGIAVADAHAPAPHGAIPAPRPLDAGPAVYAPTRQRGAILLLRQTYGDPAVPERFGGRGWVTGRELGARVAAANAKLRTGPYFAVDGTDLRWTVLWGLVERRNDNERAGVVWWRITEQGRRVRLLEWTLLPAGPRRSEVAGPQDRACNG